MAKLRTLLENLEVTALRGSLEAALDQEITALVYDSRKITKDCLFVCIEGANFDGHSAAAQAVSQGAAVLVVQKPVEVPQDGEVLILQVESTRLRAGLSGGGLVRPSGFEAENHRHHRDEGKKPPPPIW